MADDDEWADFIHREPLNVRPTPEQLNKAEEELLFYPSMQRSNLEYHHHLIIIYIIIII